MVFVSFVIFSFFPADDRKKGRKKETHENQSDIFVNYSDL
jgi:hypothetical protein